MTHRPVFTITDPDSPMSEEDRTTLHAATVPACHLLADLPTDHLRLNFLCSLMTTYAMNHPDPAEAMARLMHRALKSLARARIQDRERGGTA